VKHAIERTHLPLSDIAEQCGFSSLSALSHSFRFATGMSPQTYRRRIHSGGTAWSPALADSKKWFDAF
jgi:AraC-like DNA-binding protein